MNLTDTTFIFTGFYVGAILGWILGMLTIHHWEKKHNKLQTKIMHEEKYWKFARQVLIEIKKQQKTPLKKFPQENDIAFNVHLLLDKKEPIPIEHLGEY